MGLAVGTVAVLVLAHDRPRYLARTLRSLLRARGVERYPIIVSQDGEDDAVSRVIAHHGAHLSHRLHLARPARAASASELEHGYACIAAHYQAALGRLFRDRRVAHAIVVEDDLDLAPDFFSFFELSLPVLERDPSLWAVSAWNDNGRAAHAIDPRRIVRSDWFPNLGWSISRRLWEELGPHWPERYWDDWMRAPARRRGRATLRPEVSRVRTFGARGISRGQHYRRHIAPVVLNRDPDALTGGPLVGLERAAYDRAYLARVAAAAPVAATALAALGRRRWWPRRWAALGGRLHGGGRDEATEPARELRITYRDEAELVALLRRFGLMDDVRGGTARTSYRGVVELRHRGRLVFLAPAAPVMER